MERVRRARRWWHRVRGHVVVRTVVRDMSRARRERFYYRRGYQCVQCRMLW